MPICLRACLRAFACARARVRVHVRVCVLLADHASADHASGDSISANGSGYFLNVKQMLEEYGTASVQHTGNYGKGICGTSFGVLACWDLWSGAGGFDVIHFNWGQ